MGSPIDEPADALTGEPAGLWRRLGAMIYDALLILALWMFTLLLGVAVTNHPVTGPLWQSLLFLELFAFFAYFWLRRRQTLGMLAWKLYVLDSSGAHITLGQALLRFIGAILSFLCLGLGYLWILIDHSRRSWSDLLSGSRVIHSPADVPTEKSD